MINICIIKSHSILLYPILSILSVCSIEPSIYYFRLFCQVLTLGKHLDHLIEPSFWVGRQFAGAALLVNLSLFEADQSVASHQIVKVEGEHNYRALSTETLTFLNTLRAMK